MAKTNENKEGYKKTRLGWIPEEWNTYRLKKLGKITSGGTPNRDKLEYWNGNIPWVTTSNINFNVLTKTDEFISELGLNNSSAKLFDEGTLLMAMYGQGKTRGKVALLGIRATTNQACAAICLNGEAESNFVFYNLSNRYHEIRSYSNTGNQENLNAEIIKNILVSLPPLPEQRAIATCLTTWDKAIAATQKLIEQKQLKKKWLMQNLLTGKKRLNGFNGEWKEVRLSRIFSEIKEVNDGGNGHSIMTISAKLGLVSQQDKFDRIIAGDSLKKYILLKKGDFAYNKGNSKTYPMGCIYQLEEFNSALVPFVYICFSPTDLIDSGYYKQWFLGHGLDGQLKKIITSGARGDGLLNVNKKDFFKLKTMYPPIEEQTAIAQILQTADKEIELLRNKLDKLKEQKKGLMQVLLTGKKRLNQDAQD